MSGSCGPRMRNNIFSTAKARSPVRNLVSRLTISVAFNFNNFCGDILIGCNQSWIAEQTGTSIAMIQDHYGKFICDDGDALLRAYVEERESDAYSHETETFSDSRSNYQKILASPTGFEPKHLKKRTK